MYKTWTPFEKQLIEQNALKLTDTELHAEILKNGGIHTLASVRKYRQRLNLGKKPGRPTKVVKQEIINNPNEGEL